MKNACKHAEGSQNPENTPGCSRAKSQMRNPNLIQQAPWPQGVSMLRRLAIALLPMLLAFCNVSWLPAQIPTPEPSQVSGKPRLTLEHPRNIWDQEEIIRYKELLKRSPELTATFNQLRVWGDKRITQALDVPAHTLETNGDWTFPAFMRGYQDPQGKWMWEWKFNTALQQKSADISNLGILYALTGNQQYAAFAKQLLLALAEAYGRSQGSTAPDPNGYDHFEAYGFDGGDAGMFLTKSCSGYDLIYDLPTITAGDRTHIEQDLIRPLAEHLKKAKYMYTGHSRWGMVCLYGIFISGVTIDDQDMVNGSLYGLGGSKEKPTGGFMDCFNLSAPTCLRDDRLWGADQKPEDQIASLAIMVSVAEVMWHRGVDLYDYQNMAMKKPFDAGISLILLSSTAPGDTGYAKLLDIPGINAYEYACRRYQDARYLSLIDRLKPTLVMAVGELPSLFDVRGSDK